MKKIVVLLCVLLLGMAATVLWWQNGNKPVNQFDTAEKIFVIEKGKGIREIASELKKEGLVKDPIVFFLFLKLTGRDTQLQAGDFRLSASMNLPTIVNTLLHGTLDVWVTFPEGKRGEEIAAILKGKFKNYEETWVPALIENNGYLFPDTYLIPKDADISLIVSLMKNNFYGKIKAEHISTDTVALDTIVKIASLIEREAKFPEDRMLVASVISNRLENGMKLDIDATVQYALGFQKDQNSWWKKNLTHEDLKTNSPYNTYATIDLPPTPICNPGISSLKAAANPTETDYYYYVSDKEGHLHFARTIQEHNQNVGKYIGIQ